MANKLTFNVTLGVVTLSIPLLLELVLNRISGRSISPANVALSIALVVGGGLWINADRRSNQNVR
jgi:hypothetical protein